jgi:hypothetical protein
VRELATYLGSIDFGRDNHEPLADPITWIRDDRWCLKGRYRINVTIRCGVHYSERSAEKFVKNY